MFLFISYFKKVLYDWSLKSVLRPFWNLVVPFVTEGAGVAVLGVVVDQVQVWDDHAARAVVGNGLRSAHREFSSRNNFIGPEFEGYDNECFYLNVSDKFG